MDVDDRLRLDYDQTSQQLRTLTDIRFRLIAFVPTFAAASVGFFAHPRPAVELLGIGVLGLVATIGIYLYELGNTQLYAAAATSPTDQATGVLARHRGTAHVDTMRGTGEDDARDTAGRRLQPRVGRGRDRSRIDVARVRSDDRLRRGRRRRNRRIAQIRSHLGGQGPGLARIEGPCYRRATDAGHGSSQSKRG